MSTASLLLAWLACICTSLAAADGVAGTSFAAAEAEAKAAEVPRSRPPPSAPPSKCLNTCVTAGDAICQDGGLGGFGTWETAGVSCEYGTDCTDCGPRLIPVVHVTEGRVWTLCADPYPYPIEECDVWSVPTTTYIVNFPVAAGTTDLTASIRGHGGTNDACLWADVRAELQSYLQCLEPECVVQIGLRGGTNVKALVTDFSGNGSSTATLERATALNQEGEARALLASLPEALFKAPGTVTVSAPRKDMVSAGVHYPDGEPPENPPPPTARPSEPVAKAAWPGVETNIYGIDLAVDILNLNDIDLAVDILNPYDPHYFPQYSPPPPSPSPPSPSPPSPSPPPPSPSPPPPSPSPPPPSPSPSPPPSPLHDLEAELHGLSSHRRLSSVALLHGLEFRRACAYWFKVIFTGLACSFWLGLMLGIMLGTMLQHKCKNKLTLQRPAKVEAVIKPPIAVF